MPPVGTENVAVAPPADRGGRGSMLAPGPAGWSDTWLDALAFGIGLGVAWWFHWNTTDLVWSLWLSSLLVGYAMILWLLTAPLRQLGAGIIGDRSGVASGAAKIGALALIGVGTLFGIAFFTVHFGGFHFVHSVFLNAFFPVRADRPGGLVNWAVYRDVFSHYWMFLPAAFLAERHAFAQREDPADTAVTPAAIEARKAKGDGMTAPYRNVIRMHLLIFFFAFAHFARLEQFAVYAVVFAVYFFPWRVLRRKRMPPAASGASAM
ncbi:MAG: DUF6498-containing protein [Opitutaceae bacterium]|nr:DUF6498-containing protein [Opitutaceae bacterium]